MPSHRICRDLKTEIPVNRRGKQARRNVGVSTLQTKDALELPASSEAKVQDLWRVPVVTAAGFIPGSSRL